jgi:hypothetical protein
MLPETCELLCTINMNQCEMADTLQGLRKIMKNLSQKPQRGLNHLPPKYKLNLLLFN